MAAVLEIDESNGATEVVTDGLTAINAGPIDSATLMPATSPIVAGTNSYEKWLRIHLTALGGAAAIDTFKVWAGPPPADTAFYFNGSTAQATYQDTNHRQTVYAAPTTTTTRTPEVIPITEPASANIGIAGSLTGQLSAVGRSDYILLQVRVDILATSGGTVSVSFGYQIVA
jgi:hypothetical protein